MTTTGATTTAAEVVTTSAPHESFDVRGRPGDGAAAARTQALYGTYARTVSGLCRALLRDRAEAEDATQQTFLSAHRALLNGTDPREPAAWLATIARNECWTRIRGRMREPLPSSELETASERHDPLAEAIRRADLAALWRAIEELPRPQRDALLLREFGGLSYDELAEALAVSGPAIESLLFRARQRLRLQLRAAFASFGGASWLESLARLFGGAPVAAKLTALGVGAATVTGSAVVVPHVLEQSRSPVPPARAQLPSRHVPRVRHEAATAPPEVAQLHARAPQRALVPAGSDDRFATHETAGDGRHDGGEGGQAARSGRDGPGRALVQTGSVQHEGGGTGEEAGVTVQTEPQTLETTTTDGRDGDSGPDGGSSGPDGGSSGPG